MKVARISNPYPAYLNDFYNRSPHLVNAPYEDQMDALARDAATGFGSWWEYLDGVDFEVAEFSANNEAAQRAWLRDHQKSRLADLPWFHAVLLAQLEKFQPDILFMQDYATFPAAFVQLLRERLPSVRKAFVWCGAPYSDAEVFRAYDGIFSCVPELVADFKSKGHRCILSDHGFDERVLHPLSTIPIARRGVTFIGQIVRQAGFHGQREKLLRELLRFDEFEIYSPSAALGFSDLGKYGVRFFGAQVRAVVPNVLAEKLPQKIFPKQSPYFPVWPSLWLRAQAAVFGLDMYAVLRDSLGTINRHIDISSGSASNMRLFEATGMGTCLITDAKPDLKRFFSDDEVVTYASNEECVEKVNWLRDNPEEAKAIGERGRKRTLKDHGLSQRLPELARHIRSSV